MRQIPGRLVALVNRHRNALNTLSIVVSEFQAITEELANLTMMAQGWETLAEMNGVHIDDNEPDATGKE